MKGAQGLFEWSVRVEMMVIEDVYVVEAEALKALIEAREQVFREPRSP